MNEPAQRTAWKPDALILALIYEESMSADACLCGIAAALRAQGWRLAGLVQHNLAQPQRTRCDMDLEDLANGTFLRISEDRGAQSSGCVLMVDELLKATEAVRTSLSQEPDAVLLNKFGKTEAEGGGMRSLIGEVVERRIPLLIAVPVRNLPAWREFAGGLATEFAVSAQERSILETLRFILGRDVPMASLPELPRLGECRNSGAA